MDRRRLEISLGVLVIATLAILAYIALQMGHLKGIGSYVRAQVVFDNAAGLVEGAAVRVAGVQVGRVETLKVDFDKARATLLLDGDTGIRQDARVSIRARSLLGEKYVELTPVSRTAPLVENGSTLEAAPSGLEIDQIITEMGPVLRDLDVKEVGPLLEELKGLVSENRSNVTRSVEQLHALLGRLEKVEFDDPALQADVRVLLRNLRKTSEALPGMLEETDKAIAQVTEKAIPLMERLDQTVARLDPALQRLPETMDRLNTTLVGVDRLMTRLEPMLARAETIDYSVFKKLLREEGLLIRFAGQEVEWEGARRAQERQDTPPRLPAEGASHAPADSAPRSP